ncbi:MAG TPA: beta-galactosidase GalA [Anaerolineae bacterium]|nr:beta-galactosidase GalA [Anaerolineae bacterium]HQI86649.1 beta-galactosidase GalA [Anaerolineae bacterium]
MAHRTANRERLLMDFGWRFALGHAYDAQRDFNHGTSYFSYMTKTGYGDGPAAKNFDDRGWRILDLPHDWCVELPFDARGGHSHGYKAIGRAFPENSVGWYRKRFFIPASDLGRRIVLEFDGVHRDAIVWVNGFYVGNEHSGYTSFRYDISDYLDYGGDNVVAVRADATLEEGWFYEGAGIYRHVWLTKTAPLHVAPYGTFVTPEIDDDGADITIRTTVINEGLEAVTFDLTETIVDAAGSIVASGAHRCVLGSGEQREFASRYHVANPRLWSLADPHLYRLDTTLCVGEDEVDTYTTSFGIRTVRFDPDAGFFLNGERVELMGTNMHQDHAGVGTAIPDALQAYRVRQLQAMGSNAIRTAHNPPTPELLDACDRLGMLVLDENRLMGCNAEHLSCLERLIKRDRNHPSVVLWSLGNEEWAIEGNVKGARITATMQRFAQTLDPSRAFTVACSGGWDTGSGMVAQVMGYNYIVQGDIDTHHARFPWQAGVGTEETTTHQTRGVYVSDPRRGHIAPENRMPENVGTESGWQFYAARPFLAGLFYWTGFDYHGEPINTGWPVVVGQFGLFDLCGFPKDGFYYLKAWWGKAPVLHIATHWNWPGREGETIPVTVYSNCEEVELFLNGASLGRQAMPVNGHLEWHVTYAPGTLLAHGYRAGQRILTAEVAPTGEAAALHLTADRLRLQADGADVAVVAVHVHDAQGWLVPTAENEIHFTLAGPGKIIGVGNGDPSSHEAERFIEGVSTAPIVGLKELAVDQLADRPEVAAGFDDTDWKPAFQDEDPDWQVYKDPLIVVRGIFELPALAPDATVTLLTKSIVEDQSVYVNGHLLAANVPRDDPHQAYRLAHAILKAGRNDYAVTGRRLRKQSMWEELNRDPGLVQIVVPVEPWQRKAFNGLAQVIVQSTREPGSITLTAFAAGLETATLTLEVEKQ